MKSVKNTTVCVVDYGYFFPIAERLARDCDKVYVTTMWQDSMPKWNKYAIGMGMDNVERVDSIWDVIDECDWFVFPDLYQAGLQEYLVSIGKVVFGARYGEDMEIYRDDLKELMEKVGLPVNDYNVIEGFSALKKYLKNKEDLYIKTNLIRGSGETFHYISHRLSESRLDRMQEILGAFKEEAVFVVEKPIPDAVEVGYDGFSIEGQFPEIAMCGIEVKDCGYVGGLVPYESLPECVTEVNEKLSKAFKKTNYRCFFSSEIRWDKKTGYLIDSTNRAPNPPGFLMCEIIDNFSQVLWEIANGEVPVIKPAAKFGAQVIIKSSMAAHSPQAVYFPSKVKDRVKIQCPMIKDGVLYYIPLTEDHEEVGIGSVIGLGDTMEEAIEDAKRIAEMVEGDSISINCDDLVKAKGQIEKAAEYGIELFKK